MFEQLPTQPLLEIKLPWNAAIELNDDDQEVWRVLNALDVPNNENTSDDTCFTHWKLPATHALETLLEDRFEGCFEEQVTILQKLVHSNASAKVNVSVMCNRADYLFVSDFHDENWRRKKPALFNRSDFLKHIAAWRYHGETIALGLKGEMGSEGFDPEPLYEVFDRLDDLFIAEFGLVFRAEMNRLVEVDVEKGECS